jgi:hypothetical protein
MEIGMNFRLIMAAVCGLAAGASGQGLKTASLAIETRGGCVIGMVNRRTSERYVDAPKGTTLTALLHRLRQDRPWSATRTAVDQSGSGTIVYRMTRGNDRLTTRFTIRGNGDIEVRQSGAGGEPGIYGASLAIGPIPDRYEVLVPGNSGQRFGKDAPYETRTFEYPLGWEAAFVIIQGPRGGVLIQAEDPALSPKVLTVARTMEGFVVRLESRCEAPFEPLRQVNGIRWVIRAYRGPWQIGAAMYRRWAASSYGLTALHAVPAPAVSDDSVGLKGIRPASRVPRTPAWAANIRFVAIVGLDIQTIRLLARRVAPKLTLLYVPGWRRDGYDRNYPDYTPAPEFGGFVDAAHRLGFRVMPHVNYFGCDPKNPEYERFKRYHMRDPFTKEPLWWDWNLAEPPIKFAYINPASREWRALFVERMQALCRQYDIDALHLDQTLCIFNDANGRIDGMTCAEGNIALHRELKKALPNVALSGEGLNEVTCRFEEFAQRHVYGIDHVEGSWNDRQLAMAHPVSSAVLCPYTTIYGYLGLPNPIAAPELLAAWQRAYDRFGVIPTYAWPDAGQLGSAPPFQIERLLRRGGLFMRYGLVPDFRANWSPEDLFVWRTRDGGRVRVFRNQGTALEMRLTGQDAVVLERRIEGVERFRGGGSIAGWPAYDGSGVYGLHPARRYDWTPDPPDLRALHLVSVPAGWHVERAGRHADVFRIGLARHDAASATEIRLWEAWTHARVGVVASQARTVSLPGLSVSDEDTGGVVRPDGEGIFFHPPYKGPVSPSAARVRRMSFVEYSLTLPDRPNVRLSGRGSIRRGGEQSDGVRFRAVAWPKEQPDQRLLAEVLATPAQPADLRLDLSALRGKQAIIRLEADAGPRDDPPFDWGRLEMPRIQWDPGLFPSERATLRLAGATTVSRVLVANGSAAVQPASGGGAAIEADLPNVITVPLADPVTVPPDAPGGVLLRLADLPLTVKTRSPNGIEGPAPRYGPAVGEATCAGVVRPAIHEHPPTQGATLLDYFLRLPDRAVMLRTAIGIRDGSKSRGVGFRIEVNGKELFARDLLPDSGWQSAELDLSPYAGKEIVLTLVADALGDFNFDWAVWAEPEIVLRR